ncbi:MAG TPA: SDR family oxidoreductase [Myxococcota bacterium]|nr:SDR family oxidoreductase [Myxococcota bacterium]
MKLEGKVVAVTGAGDGIGRELALGLLARGAKVAAVDRRQEALEETALRAGAGDDRLSLHVVDVVDRAAVAALPAAIIERFGAVDGLINNAGVIQPFVRLHELDDAAIDHVLGVNLFGTLHMTRAFLPHLLARPEAHLVNVSSMGGFLPVPGQTVYGAAKAAVKLLTEGLHAELLDTPVKVTVVFPGAIGTNIAGNSGVTLHLPKDGGQAPVHPLEPARAAEIMLDAVERDAPRVLIGPDAKFMDALYRLAPERALRFITRQMRGLLGASS